MSQVKAGDRVRVKQFSGEIQAEDWRIMAEPQVVEFADPMPLDEDGGHQLVSLVGFMYGLSSHDLELIGGEPM